jgi:hypothetical protein
MFILDSANRLFEKVEIFVRRGLLPSISNLIHETTFEASADCKKKLEIYSQN